MLTNTFFKIGMSKPWSAVPVCAAPDGPNVKEYNVALYGTDKIDIQS
jgi:hypothetical protein